MHRRSGGATFLVVKRFFVCLVIAACAEYGPAYPVAPPGAPYPLRWEKLSPSAQGDLQKKFDARNPGWRGFVDDYGFLVSAQYLRAMPDAPTLSDDEIAMFQRFVDENRDVLGLDRRLDVRTQPLDRKSIQVKIPMTKEWWGSFRLERGCALDAKAPKAEECVFLRVDGHAWPGFVGLPKHRKSDGELVARYVGLPAQRSQHRCSEEERHPCDPPPPCPTPVPEPTEAIRLSAGDLVVSRRYQPWTNPKTGALELRLLAEINVRSDESCRQADGFLRDAVIPVIHTNVTFQLADAVTGELLTAW